MTSDYNRNVARGLLQGFQASNSGSPAGPWARRFRGEGIQLIA